MKNLQIIKDCKIGENTKIYDFVNLYGCEIGANCMIGTFVEIQKQVKIGDYCRIQSHTFICEGVTLEDEVFVGHNVAFINDNYPSVERSIKKTWKVKKTLVKRGATIGSGAVILGGIIIGEKAMIGAGSVVTKNVPPGEVVVGVPAKKLQ